MTTPTASTNLTPAMRAAAQTDQWREPIRQALFDLRVAIPGTILSFDAVAQTAVVQIALREKIWAPHAGTTDVAIAPLQDVPVVLPRGGGYSLTLPITAGDECLLIFADMCIDTWWASGGVQNQFEKRRHDLSDAFCIPGPWNQKRKLTNYSTDSVQLRSDDPAGTVVDVAGPGVTMTTPLVVASQNLQVGNGATGSFTTPTGQVVTVQDGIITNIY